MTARNASHRAIAALSALALLGVCAAPRAARCDIVSSAELSFERAGADRPALWRPSLALASPATEFGLAPGRDLVPRAHALEPGARSAAPTGAERWSFRVTNGPTAGHGALTELRADWRGEMRGERRGGWLALGAGGVTGGDARVAPPFLGLGAWARRDRMSVLGSVDQTLCYTPASGPRTVLIPVGPGPDSLMVWDSRTEPGRPGDLLTVTRVQSRLGWSLPALDLEAVGGVDVGPGLAPLRWAQANLSFSVLPRVRMFASYGSPTRRLFAETAAAGSRASAGVRLVPLASLARGAARVASGEIESWRLSRSAERRYRFELRVAAAGPVELMGDMTDWQPVALAPRGDSRWETALDMAPGVHQLVVRVAGGAWVVPRGMTSTTSDFGDPVGVLLAR